MSLKRSDFGTREEAYEYATQRLEIIKELEHDTVLLSETPNSEELLKIVTKWQERAAKLQEVQT